MLCAPGKHAGRAKHILTDVIGGVAAHSGATTCGRATWWRHWRGGHVEHARRQHRTSVATARASRLRAALPAYIDAEEIEVLPARVDVGPLPPGSVAELV